MLDSGAIHNEIDEQSTAYLRLLRNKNRQLARSYLALNVKFVKVVDDSLHGDTSSTVNLPQDTANDLQRERFFPATGFLPIESSGFLRS